MRLVDKSTNILNQRVKENNTTGYTGVGLVRRSINTPFEYIKSYITINGKTRSKLFNIKKNGYDESLQKAIQTRERWEEEFGIPKNRE